MTIEKDHGQRESVATSRVYVENEGFSIGYGRAETKNTEVALHIRSYEKVFWKYMASLQENIHAKLRFE